MNKMKKYLLIIVSCVLLVVLILIRKNYYENRVINKKMYTLYRYNKDIVSFRGRTGVSYTCGILEEALSGFYKWEQLPLTNHFKNKYKNRKNILKEIDNIEWLGVGVDNYENETILVMADKKDNILNEWFFPSTTVECYYKYKMDGDKLDDIELIKKQYVVTPTGEVLKKFKIDGNDVEEETTERRNFATE